MARYYHTREEKIIAAAILLGLSTLAGLIGYFAGYHVGKNKEVVMALEPDPIPVQTPVVPAEAQAEDTVQMTPEEIAKYGVDIAPNEKPAEKVGFKPKKTKTYRVVTADQAEKPGTIYLKKGEKYRPTPEMFDKYDEEPSLVKIYRVVEAENDGR